MASLRLKFESPFGAGSLLLSLGLHLAVVLLVLMAGWQKPPAAPPVLEVSLVALPGEPGPPGPDAGGSAPEAKAPAAQPAAAPQAAPKAAPPAAPRRQSRPQPPPPVRVQAARPQPGPAAPSPPASAALPDRPYVAGAGGRGSFGDSGGAAASGATGSGSGEMAGAGRGRGGPGGPGGGSGGLAAAQNRYLSLIRARILAHRHYPPMARARQMEGVVHLRFTLAANGSLSRGVQIVKPSGFTVLDEQASRCVLAAAPFPPFPAELQRDSLTVEVPIVYQLKDWAG
jgi:periplasmic protein TonB